MLNAFFFDFSGLYGLARLHFGSGSFEGCQLSLLSKSFVISFHVSVSCCKINK